MLQKRKKRQELLKMFIKNQKKVIWKVWSIMKSIEKLTQASTTNKAKNNSNSTMEVVVK